MTGPIILECEQGDESPEWIEARLGVLTASRTKCLLTPTRKVADNDAVRGLCYQLVAERLIREPCDTVSGPWLERGNLMEPKARTWYEFAKNLEVRQVGFIYRNEDRRVGCSPDGLVLDDGGLEIKCPAAKTMVGYHLNPGTVERVYAHQVQMSLWVTGRAWWDLLAYCPKPIGSILVRVYPDVEYHAALEEACAAFAVRMDEAEAQIRGLDPHRHIEDEDGRVAAELFNPEE